MVPPRIRWAVANVCFGVVFLAAGAGDYASLGEPVISDKWVHAAEVFESRAILLKVPVVVGLQAQNPAVNAAAEAVEKVDFMRVGILSVVWPQRMRLVMRQSTILDHSRISPTGTRT